MMNLFNRIGKIAQVPRARLNKLLLVTALLLSVSVLLNVLLFLQSRNLANRVEKLIGELSLTIEQKNELRNSNYLLFQPSPSPESKVKSGVRRYHEKFNISYFCYQDWVCNLAEENLMLIEVKEKNQSASLSINIVNNSNLNNPNYNSVMNWYDGLLRREGEAVGENIDELYGAESVPGTDGLTFPFYKSYELDELTLYMFGENPGLIARRPSTYATDFLIPNDQLVYKFTLGSADAKKVDLALQFLSQVEFGMNDGN